MRGMRKGVIFSMSTLTLFLLPPPGTHHWSHAPHDPSMLLPVDLDWDPREGLIIECKNVQNLHTCQHVMARRRAHITLAQEISCSPLRFLKGVANAARQLVASQVDPNFTHLTGGVGAIGRQTVQVFEIPPVTPSFADFCKRGRVIHVGLGCSKTSRLRLRLHQWP